MKPASGSAVFGIAAAFFAGFFTYYLYQRWNPSAADRSVLTSDPTSFASPVAPLESRAYPVTFLPSSSIGEKAADLPIVQARDVEKIRGLAGRKAKIRGRIFRVGHSSKSNTYFLNFGPSREALTGVIFASAAELFEKNKFSPKEFAGKEVEIQGEIKDHPQYGLEMILENPSQIKIIN